MDRCRRCFHHIYWGTISISLETFFLCLNTFSSFSIRNKMRKTRLVILPTKCLHQMGFLLLFLSCPVIGDWGRIRPESESSHNAIQIEREGTCGFERDPPGGLFDFLNETGSKQCRLSEDSDLSKPTEKPSLEEPVTVRKSDESRVYTRRVNQRESERRITQRRDTRREFQRNVRSRSVESRRSNNRNDVRVRSLSLSRLESERSVRDRSTRRYNAENRRETERLHMTRQNERRVEQQRRLIREIPNERREIRGRNIAERRERETRRLTRSTEREREDIRRDNNRRVLARRENDIRNQDHRERRENVRERLSLTRREIQNLQERTENRRSTIRLNLERRQPEMRKARSLDNISRERITRTTRNSDPEERRMVSLPLKRSIRERRITLLNERLDGKARRMYLPEVREIKLENKHSEDKKPEEISEWTNFKNYESFQTGDWATNCIIGAAVYYFTTRQIKAV